MIILDTIQAGGFLEYSEQADFFRVLEAGAPLTVIFYAAGREIARAEKIGAGYSEKFSVAFDKVRLLSQVNNPVNIAMRYGNTITYDQPPNGAVNGSFVQALKTVGTVSGVLLNANTSRRYLLIQNNAVSGDIFVRLDGAAATIANGVKIEAGGSYELQGFVTTGAVVAIGDIANTKILTVEG
ncbi:hypothetical protein [Oxalicibacterium faecigallinarum]|uniref:Uncharacterized protein n=1 Tax=Oxalicibacterium faecigallinarum TaxID=573741 RepID=A0A8J3EZE2_9BURK|nr:hypothetical protein [Oxalicibacterium faecigallinarum]GGI16895.1 hypothetical protein GCM10008066_06250 [Oxalicibacterium faecigallinarum]